VRYMLVAREEGGWKVGFTRAHQSNNLWTMITLLNHNFVFNRTIKMLINNDEHEMKMSWHENKKCIGIPLYLYRYTPDEFQEKLVF
jgi:hypothetical protein